MTNEVLFASVDRGETAFGDLGVPLSIALDESAMGIAGLSLHA